MNAFETNQFNLLMPVYMHKDSIVLENKDKDEKAKAVRNNYIRTTIGRVIFNDHLPQDFPFQNMQVKKGTVANLIKRLFNRYNLTVVGETLDKLKELGFGYATKSGLTISIVDMIDPPKKREFLLKLTIKLRKFAKDLKKVKLAAMKESKMK